MLDLGFLEDVEKILSLTPSGRQTALFSATMPPPIRAARGQLPVRPGDDQGRGGDADDRHRRAVPAAGRDARRRPDKLVEVLRAETARPGDRVRAHEDPLRPAVPDAARPRDERAGAARRHDPGLARRRDARVQGRARADPRGDRRRRARPRHLDRHARRSTTTCRPAPTPTCTGSGAPAGWGARAARSRSSRRARSASWRRSSATSACRSPPGSRARRASRRRSTSARAGTPSRASSAPRRARTRPTRSSCSAAGAPRGSRVADIVGAVTSATGLDGEAVRDVMVLERFSFLSVPSGEAERVIEALDGTTIGPRPGR